MIERRYLRNIGTLTEEETILLAGKRVCVIGCGGLGGFVIENLGRIGVGYITAVDSDSFDETNLNRQLLFTMWDLGKPKASTASIRLRALNPNLKATVYDRFLDKELAADIIPSYDVIVDCLDNFDTRFIINDTCVALRKPFIHAGIGEFYGQLMTVIPGAGPCLRCLFPGGVKEKEPKKPFGVDGPTPGVLGTLQALEAMKLLLDLPVSNEGLIIYDGLSLNLEKVAIAPATGCECRKIV